LPSLFFLTMKSYKRKIFPFFILVGIIGVFSLLPDYYPIFCKSTVNTSYGSYCFETYGEPLREPAFFMSLSLLLIFFLLLFSKEAVVKAWLRFAMFSFPIYAFFLFLSASFGDGPSGFMSSGFLSFSSEGLVLALSLLYLIISILLITFKSIQEARRPEKKRFWNKWK
jgi:hypothetical protein